MLPRTPRAERSTMACAFSPSPPATTHPRSSAVFRRPAPVRCSGNFLLIGDEALDPRSQLALEAVLFRIAGFDDLAHSPVFMRAHIDVVRPEIKVGRIGGQHVGDKLMHHDLSRTEPHIE